jgi:diguanylate cyclase (GGDEF)-like protein
VRARRSGARLGVVVAEIDDFATVTARPLPSSDQQLLANVGSVFRTAPRKIDLAARLGGGRFAMLLPYTDEHGAFLLAERIRERLLPLGARLSVGVAGFPRSGATAPAVLQHAEIALNEARDAGGNRAVILRRSPSSARVEIELPDVSERPHT